MAGSPRRIGLSLALRLLAAATVAIGEPRLIELPARDGVLPEDQRIIRLRPDDQVTLVWTTNHPVRGAVRAGRPPPSRAGRP